MTRSKSRREVLLGAAALAGTACLPRTASAQDKGPHRRRHLGRRLRPPAQQEHRGADPHQGRLGGGAGPGRRSRAALENARRAAAAARHLRCAGPFGAQHVPDARCRHRDADRLRQAQECRQSAAGDEISLRRRPHLFGQGRRLQSEDDRDRARQLQGRVRSQARQQARHHRHPVPVHDGLRGARRRRQGQRYRARQETAAGMQERRHADLSDQRGVRAGSEVGGIRHSA